MDISLVEEQAFSYIPKFTPEVAQDRIEQKKISLVAGTVASLLSRPKPADIQCISVENRLQPFWLVKMSAYTRFDRNITYTVFTTGPEVRVVTFLGQEVTPVPSAKGVPAFSLNAVEHCIDEHHVAHTYDGLSGTLVDMSKYLGFPKNEIADIDHFTSEGALVIPPQVRASVVVRQVMTEMIKPVQSAATIHEERVDVEAIELNFRPIYALEYEWAAKSKRIVIEFDGLTGDITDNGKKLGNLVKGMVTRDLLFDVTADALGIIVPGGSIAVKLVKAAIDKGK
jgi:hypothetical protein